MISLSETTGVWLSMSLCDIPLSKREKHKSWKMKAFKSHSMSEFLANS